MKQNVIDAPLAAVALTSPWWVSALETSLAIMIPLSALVLVLLRIALAIREWTKGQ